MGAADMHTAGALVFAVLGITSAAEIKWRQDWCAAHPADSKTQQEFAGHPGPYTDPENFCRDFCPPSSPGPPESKLRPLRWLHVPKTGTSFGTTVYHHACLVILNLLKYFLKCAAIFLFRFDRTYLLRLNRTAPSTKQSSCPR